MTIFNAHGGLPPVAAEALYTYQTSFSRIGRSQDDGTQHSEGSCAHAMCACSYADIAIGE